MDEIRKAKAERRAEARRAWEEWMLAQTGKVIS